MLARHLRRVYASDKGREGYGLDSNTPRQTEEVQTADARVLPELLQGEETRVWGDQGYVGQTDAIHEAAPRARDCTHRRYRYKDRIDEVERAKNRTKSSVRSKVEHVFQILKLKFGFVKVRYRGLTKNANRLFARPGCTRQIARTGIAR